MPSGRIDILVQRLRVTIGEQHVTERGDAALLRRFAANRDEAAFSALVQRHGAMVLNVCRHVLRHEQEAEDAFQATFLVLACKAGGLRQQPSVAGWLHGVAYRTALNARKIAMRRRKHEHHLQSRSAEPADITAGLHEVQTLLDAEVQRLAEKHRAPFVLCCLEGRSRSEAARALGWNEGTLSSRLAKARELLQQRLTRQGVTLAAGLAAGAVSQGPVKAALCTGAARAACLYMAGEAGALPATVTALAKAVIRGMTITQLRSLAFAVTVLLVAGAGLATHSVVAVHESGPTLSIVASPAPRTEVNREVPEGDPLPAGAVARLGSSALRIGNSAFAVTPDGKHIVAVSPEGIVRKFDAATGRQLEYRHLSDRTGVDPTGQHHAQLSTDGSTVALSDSLASERQLTTVWDVPSGKAIYRLKSDGKWGFGPYALAPRGKQLAVVERTGLRDYALVIYDLKTGTKNALGGVADNVYDIRVVREGTRVLISQNDSTTQKPTFACFDVPSGRELWRLPREGGNMAVSPDGRLLIEPLSKQSGYHVIETDPAMERPVESFKEFQPAHPNCRSVIASDNRTVVTEHFGDLVVWDFSTARTIRRIKLPETHGHGYGPCLGAISSDGRTILTNFGQMQRWDLANGAPLFKATSTDAIASEIQHMAFTADGKELFATCWSYTSALWNVTTGKLVRVTRDRLGRNLVMTADGLRALSCDWLQSGEITLFDPLAAKKLRTTRSSEIGEVGPNGIRAYSLSTDGRTLSIAYEKAKQTHVLVSDIESGRNRCRFSLVGNLWFPSVPFSPCGRWVVLAEKLHHIGGDVAVPLIGEPEEQLASSDYKTRNPVWFSADSRLLAGRLQRLVNAKASMSNELGVWEVATGKLLSRIPQAAQVCQVAFSPDGCTIALVDGRGIRIHDLLTGDRRSEYAAPDVTCETVDRGWFSQTLVFAPDGRTLATGHRDGAVVLWHVPAFGGKEIRAVDHERLWTDLASSSPATARSAVEGLARLGTIATALLTVRFRAQSSPADAAIGALVKALDSDAFATREAAMRQLRKHGATAEPALRRALDANPSLELRRRIEMLLPELIPPRLELPAAGETLLGIRAIEVLERIGTADARQLLQTWSEQAGNVHLAIEARLACERLSPKRRSP